MPNHSMLKKYMLIVEKINNKQYPNKKEIAEHLLDYGFNDSERTLERYIEKLRDEFGLGIIYDRRKRGYFIDEGKSFKIDVFLRFLEISNTANVLADTLSDSKEALQFISFEKAGSLKGIEYLEVLLQAIKNHRKIIMEHRIFEGEKAIEYHLEPYLLKEYQNRWYIIGIVEKLGKFRTFGIDRIEKIKVLEESFKPNPKMNPMELFENIVGLIYSLDKAQEIILSFTPKQGKYIKTLPIHSSQQILIDDENEFRISLHIIPNFEFKQQLLMHGDLVKVIKPDSLIEEMKNVYQNALDKYK